MHDFVPDQVEGDVLDFIPPFKVFPGVKDFDPKHPDGSPMILESEPVGSRVTCDPPPTDTDEDWLLLVDGQRRLTDMLRDEYGFSQGGSELVDGEDYREEYSFQSMTLVKLNLIITDHPEFYRRFLAASSVAKRLNLLKKDDRIALFQAVLYGNPC